MHDKATDIRTDRHQSSHMFIHKPLMLVNMAHTNHHHRARARAHTHTHTHTTQKYVHGRASSCTWMARSARRRMRARQVPRRGRTTSDSLRMPRQASTTAAAVRTCQISGGSTSPQTAATRRRTGRTPASTCSRGPSTGACTRLCCYYRRGWFGVPRFVLLLSSWLVRCATLLCGARDGNLFRSADAAGKDGAHWLWPCALAQHGHATCRA